MGERGRAGPLERIDPVEKVDRRPEPPEEFDEVASARWRALVAELPPDRFRESDLSLLRDLIRSEQYVRDCDMEINRYGQLVQSADGDLKANPAIAIRDKHLRVVVAIQRALRLCPSMRMRTESGALQKKTPGKKPWE